MEARRGDFCVAAPSRSLLGRMDDGRYALVTPIERERSEIHIQNEQQLPSELVRGNGYVKFLACHRTIAKMILT